jgi:hypothetical protein
MKAWYGPIEDMVLVGVIPILLMWALVWPFHRYNLVLKIS